MYRISKIFQFVLVSILILMKGIIAVDREDDSDSAEPSFIRAVPHPGSVPVFQDKFDFVHASSPVTNDANYKKYSIDIRMTILNTIALVAYAPDEIFVEKFILLQDKFNKCLRICTTWGHASGPFFLSLKTMLSAKHKSQHLREDTKEIINTFVISLGQASDIDSMELQFLFMPAYKEVDKRKIRTIVPRLKEKNREEMAAHYLLSYAKQVPDLDIAKELCSEAEQLGSKEAKEMAVRFQLLGDVIHGAIRDKNSWSLDAIEMGLHFMLEGIDDRYVLALVDRLIKANRKDAAIHYLLDYAERISSISPSHNPESEYSLPELYYVKAENLGSVEATDKRLKLHLKPGSESDTFIKRLMNPTETLPFKTSSTFRKDFREKKQ